MRYRIRHRTSYRYASDVFESFNEVRLQPLACATQTLLDFDLQIEPPATTMSFRDYYGNAVHDFGVAYLHDRLVIEATSDVVTHAGADDPLAGPAEGEPDASPSLRALVENEALADEHAEFLGPSAYIPLGDDSAALAESLLAEDRETSALAFLTRAADHVRGRLEYRVGTTTVNSSVAEVLAGGSGVCQDFAHVLISLCRHVGLPARYVSGYLGGVGASTASHAWTEAYIPPYGWLGIDATLGTLCTGQHVKVGVGRDYVDVAVLRGTYQGGGQAELDVQVSCEALGGVDRAAQLRGNDDEPIARLVAIQNLGATRQFRRGAVMTQAMGGTTETLAVEELPPPRVQARLEDGPPSQQPQQQQQQRPRARRTEAACRLPVRARGDGSHCGGRPRRAAPRIAGSAARRALEQRAGARGDELRRHLWQPLPAARASAGSLDAVLRRARHSFARPRPDARAERGAAPHRGPPRRTPPLAARQPPL